MINALDFIYISICSNNTSSTDLLASNQQQRNDPFWGPCGLRDGEEDISSFLEGVMPESGDAASSNSKLSGGEAESGKDSIAEPLYSLMGEVFDMAGVFKWLRRSVISFVQITYGRTINRYTIYRDISFGVINVNNYLNFFKTNSRVNQVHIRWEHAAFLRLLSG